MYRVVAIVGAGLVLAACSTDSKNFFGFEPAKETIRFESEPPGAEAKTSTGETCRTPCALAMPADKPFTVTFTLTGYQPATEQVQLTSIGVGASKLTPNPVLVQLTSAPPPKPKKVRRKKKTAKPTPKPKPAAAKPAPAATPAPPPMTPAPQPQATSPWPAAPPPQSR